MTLPDSWEELEAQLDTGADLTNLFDAFATTLGIHTECQRCGLKLVDARTLADEITAYYDLDPAEAQIAAYRLEDEIEYSSVEQADQWAALCSSCESLYFAPKSRVA